jgi:hypothetical protein
MVLASKNTVNKTKKDNQLLSKILRMQISRPNDFNWKEDYVKAMDEKYANIH